MTPAQRLARMQRMFAEDAAAEKVTTLCETTKLWFHGMRWDHDSPRNCLLKCATCARALDALVSASVDRQRLPTQVALRGEYNMLEVIENNCRTAGRYDLAILLHAFRVSYALDIQIPESVIRYLMSDILALKSDRISRAMKILQESDGD